jgi:hypothetical protein
VEVREAMAVEKTEAAGKMGAAVKEMAVKRVEGEAKVKETVGATVTVLEMAQDVVVKTMGIAAVGVGRPRVTGIKVTGVVEAMSGAPVIQEMVMAAGKVAEAVQPVAARMSERVAV